MRKKLMCIFMCMLMIISAMTTILYSNNGKVEASGGGSNGGTGLDYNFMWNVTKYLSDIINTSYFGNVIRKGRSFGTVGERGSAAYINDTIMTEKLHLENVKKLQLGPIYIDGLPYLQQPYRKWYYTNKVDVDNYDLTLNLPGYPYADAVNGRLPYNETFTFPSACKNILPGCPWSLNYNHTFTGVRLWNQSINVTWPLFGGQFTGQWYNVANCSMVNCQSLLIGNATYVENVSSLPEDQEGRVLLIDKKQGCVSILENITNASAAVLIQDDFKYYVNQSVINNCSCPVAQVNSSETNLTTVINELKNGTVMMADNYYDNQTISFTYGFDGILNWNWPDYDFFILLWCNEANLQTLLIKSFAVWLFNIFLHYPFSQHGWCHGFIFYGSNENTHDMNNANRNWIGYATNWLNQRLGKYFDTPGLQMFSVNHSVGKWLKDNISDPDDTVSGFIKQTFFEEKHIGDDWTPGVTAYNVEGNITTKNNPTNAIVICSNRYDAWWGQCPGDSGAGAGMVLAIAKYMKDNNITPKYNITFLEDTGEEYGYRGAWHYNHSHPPDQFNIIRWIGFDQLGIKQDTGTFKLIARCNDNDTDARILKAIAKDIDLGIAFDTEEAKPGGGVTEDVAWLTRPNCKTILFAKDGPWLFHHETGQDFIEGDSMKNMNRSELNATLDLAWGVMKYYTVNPDCSFDNVIYTAFDSPNDGDTLLDSIRANFSISSILPSDKVRVDVLLLDQNDEEVASSYADYTITNLGLASQSITLTLPPEIAQEYCKLQLRLYNSTGWINKIVNIDDTPNETRNSNYFHLYHPFGYPTVGYSHASTENMIRGSYFTVNEYGTARNITAYVQANTSNSSVHSVCMIYRLNDSKFIGRTQEISPVTAVTPRWIVYNFTTPYPILEKNTEYVLTCWSNSPCNLYYDIIYEGLWGRFENRTYGRPPDPAQWNGTDHKLYSLYCSYVNDTSPPSITNVTESPHTVGFGFNVTISADVMDNVSGVNTVTIQINYPSGLGSSSNDTMTHISDDTYQYIFNNTWLVGQYNYTIWATDNSNNTGSSSRHHFHVSATATINIATLKNSYSGSQYINITDPPNPPENLTVVARGLTWNTYYNASTGENILETYQGPVNYQEDNHTWMPINNSLRQLATDHPAYNYGYRTGNNRGLFGVYFKPNAQNDWPVAFTYNRSDDPTTQVIRSKLVGVGYVDPQSNWAYQYLQNVQSSQGQTNGNSVTYEGVFTGTNVTWSYGNTELKEEITLNNVAKTVMQNHPPSQYGLNDASSYLVFITKLDHENLNIYNASGMLTGNVTISNAGIDFKDALGQFKCALPLGEAYELNNESVRQKLTYRIVHLNGNTYLLSGLKVSDLNAMMFPVVIDPTLTVNSLTNDGYIYNSNSNYNTAWTASTGTISSSATYLSIGQSSAGGIPNMYNIYRSFVLFNTSSLPSNAYLDNATLSLYKKDDYTATDFLLTIQNGQPTYPHNPMQTGDYAKSHYSGNGGGLNATGFVTGWNNITLSDLTWVNKTGTTKLCLRSSRDINGNTPTGSEYVNVYSANALPSQVPRLILTYRNQSKIKNTGSTNIKGYLLIQVQFYNISQGKWLVDNDTVNETSARIINSGSQLGLDTIFNGRIRASNLQHGIGTYRVYTAFRDPEGNILKTNTESELKAWWQFSKT